MPVAVVPNYSLCLVSRVTPVQTALRNCTGDEGGPFGFGDQVADPKPPQAAAVKSRGGERCGKVGTRSRQVWSREASASEPSTHRWVPNLPRFRALALLGRLLLLCVDSVVMQASEKPRQLQTHAPHQIASLFDHRVG